MQTKSAAPVVSAIHFKVDQAGIPLELKIYIQTDCGTRIVRREGNTWVLAHELIEPEIKYIKKEYGHLIEKIKKQKEGSV